MRIEITLRPHQREAAIPINYYYPLSAAIYNILKYGSPEYAEWLHARGYLNQYQKPLKLFVFSQIFAVNGKGKGDALHLYDYSECKIFISSPMLFDFVSNFVRGLFQKGTMFIGNKKYSANFDILRVEEVPDPDFEEISKENDKIYFRAISPIVASVPSPQIGAPCEYLRPNDIRLSEVLRKNLLEKYRVIHGEHAKDKNLEFILDHEEIHRKGGYQKLSKLISIKEGQPSQTRIKTFLTNFHLKGSPELISCAHECGIGEKNSLGLGMIMYWPYTKSN